MREDVSFCIPDSLTHYRIDKNYFWREIERMQNYILVFREPGKRPNTTRWARRKVSSVREATEWMIENGDKAFLPASVETPGNQWQQSEVVAILR